MFFRRRKRANFDESLKLYDEAIQKQFRVLSEMVDGLNEMSATLVELRQILEQKYSVKSKFSSRSEQSGDEP